MNFSCFSLGHKTTAILQITVEYFTQSIFLLFPPLQGAVNFDKTRRTFYCENDSDMQRVKMMESVCSSLIKSQICP